MKRYRMWIGGEWVDAHGGAIRKLVNPATAEALMDVPEAGAADVRKALAAARKALDEGSWSRAGGKKRARILLKIADLVRKSAPELSRLDSENMGKPLAE